MKFNKFFFKKCIKLVEEVLKDGSNKKFKLYKYFVNNNLIIFYK
jgi:hypothetical protein